MPFTYIEHESNGKLWPGIHQMFGAVERFQVVNSYGLFRRMTGVGGRPEVILEGSYDGHSWTVRRGTEPRDLGWECPFPGAGVTLGRMKHLVGSGSGDVLFPKSWDFGWEGVFLGLR